MKEEDYMPDPYRDLILQLLTDAEKENTVVTVSDIQEAFKKQGYFSDLESVVEFIDDSILSEAIEIRAIRG